MNWFKHMADASEDEFLQEIGLKWGPTGIGIWWCTIEFISQNFTPDKKAPKLTTTPAVFARRSFTTTEIFEKFASDCVRAKKWKVRRRPGKLEIEIPKILYMASEYTKKAKKRNQENKAKCPDNDRTMTGHYPENVPLEQTTAEERRKDKIRADSGGNGRAIDFQKKNFALSVLMLADAGVSKTKRNAMGTDYPLGRVYNVWARAKEGGMKNPAGFVVSTLESDSDVPDIVAKDPAAAAKTLEELQK